MILNPKRTSGILAIWVLDVQDYDFTINHASGPNFVLPDTLSRDEVQKPLSQICYRPLRNYSETICNVLIKFIRLFSQDYIDEDGTVRLILNFMVLGSLKRNDGRLVWIFKNMFIR